MGTTWARVHNKASVFYLMGYCVNLLRISVFCDTWHRASGFFQSDFKKWIYEVIKVRYRDNLNRKYLKVSKQHTTVNQINNKMCHLTNYGLIWLIWHVFYAMLRNTYLVNNNKCFKYNLVLRSVSTVQMTYCRVLFSRRQFCDDFIGIFLKVNLACFLCNVIAIPVQ